MLAFGRVPWSIEGNRHVRFVGDDEEEPELSLARRLDGWDVQGASRVVTVPDDKVRIDPEFRPTEPDGEGGPGLRWAGIAAMVLAAFVLGWLLRSSPSETPERTGLDTLPAVATRADTSEASAPETGPPSSPVPSVPPEQAVSNVPLREAVPGFVDTITALTWGNHGVDILRWRASQPAPETIVSLDHDDGAWNRSVDASGRWFADIRGNFVLTVHHVNDGNGRSRRPQFEEMAGAQAWSAVWHDTRPGRLAWLGCSRENPVSSSNLYTVDVSVHAAQPVALPLPDFACEDPGVWLARWGDWGTLLHTTEGSGTAQVLLNAEGTEIAKGRLGPEGEWFVGVGPGGSTVWTEGLGKEGASSFLLSPEGLHRRPVPGLNLGERLESALGSPDGSLLVLVPDLVASYGSVVRIVEADTGSVIAEITEPSWWVTRMVWSTDGRFLVYERWPDVTSNWAGVPQNVELVFYDTKAQAVAALPLPGYAPALRSAP